MASYLLSATTFILKLEIQNLNFKVYLWVEKETARAKKTRDFGHKGYTQGYIIVYSW